MVLFFFFICRYMVVFLLTNILLIHTIYFFLTWVLLGPNVGKVIPLPTKTT